MALYTVAYDLNTPGRNYTLLLEALREFDHFHAQKSLWLINTSGTPFQLRDHLSPHLDTNDTLMVSQVFGDCWAFYNSGGAAEWLKARGA